MGGEKRTTDYLERETDGLNQRLTRCGIRQAILFGHSDGGSITLLTAARYPGVVLGILTEGAHIFVEEITLTGIRSAVQAYATTNLSERLRKYHGDKTDAVFRAWTDTWLSDAFRSWNIESWIPAINCPALISQGEQDEYGSLAQVQDIRRLAIGPVSLLLLPGWGHTPH